MPADVSRSHRVTTSVTQREFEQLSDLALRDEIAMSAVVYRLLRGALSQTIADPPGKEV
jgi:hypothetical protein